MMKQDSYGRVRRVIHILFLCYVGGLSFLWGLDPHTAVEKFIHHFWSTRDGLPQNSIYSITQDGGGYLWLGTDQGVVRFDGTQFINFNTDNAPSLGSNTITSVYVTPQGILWIAAYGGGVSCLKERRFQNYSTVEGLPSLMINVIIQDREYRLWVGGIGGIACLEDGKFKRIPEKEKFSNDVVLSLLPDRQGYLWIGTEKGLNRYNPSTGENVVFTSKDGLAGDNIRVLYEDRKGYLWIGTATGISIIRNRTGGVLFHSLSTREGLTGNGIRSIIEDRDSNIWITTNEGLNRIPVFSRLRAPGSSHPVQENVPAIEKLTVEHGLTGNELSALYEDKWGNLWIGTTGSGLNMLREGRFDFYTPKDGLSSGYIKAIYQDREKVLWFGTHGGGLNRLKEGKFSVYTKENGLSSNYIESLVGDEEGNLWVGTPNGLNRMKNGEVKVYTELDGLSNTSIRSLYYDSRRNFWVGTFGGGLNLYEKGRFRFFDRGSGLSDNFVLALEEDVYGNLWIGTNQGVSCFDHQGNIFRKFSAVGDVPVGIILDIYSDADGVLWIATQHEGLIRYKDGIFNRVNPVGGPGNSSIYSILEDDRSQLWLSSNKGIYSASRRGLNRFVERKGSFVNWRHFQEEDGLITSVCTGGFQPSAWKSNDGMIWFPTIKGVAVMDLKRPTLVVQTDGEVAELPSQFSSGIAYVTVYREQPVVIEKVVADGVEYEPKERIMLARGAKEIEFHFTTIRYGETGDILYKYRLAEYDKDWIKTEKRMSRVYRGLAGGEYRFIVLADQGNGRWSSQPASCWISIGTAFYTSFWFYLVLIFVLVLGIYFLPRLFRRRMGIEQAQEDKYKGSSLSVKQSKVHLNALLKIMKEEKPFLDADITLQSLAAKMGITKEDLSRVINEQLGKNFKNFINERRIEEARVRLMDPKEQQFVLLKIAFDVGFSSKSAFNASFKKYTGMSPTAYRKKYHGGDIPGEGGVDGQDK